MISRKVVASQNKMLARRNEPVGTREEDEKMMKRYGMHLRKTEFLLDEEPHFDCLYVTYTEVLDDPRGHARKIARFLGMNVDTDRMAAAVDRSLYRNRREAVEVG